MQSYQVPRSTAGTDRHGASLAELHTGILACRRCVGAGFLPGAAPVLPRPVRSRLMLIGQAPGRLEEQTRLPFSGRAGRQLFRWLEAAGFGSEEQARRAVYLTSITKCFPGPAKSGAGDRRPSASEIALCGSHLDAQLGLLRPWLVIAVGQLAIGRFLAARPMDQLIGQVFEASSREGVAVRTVPAPDRLLILPLPHPSGASRWLNQSGHREQLEAALRRLRELVRVRDGLPEAPSDCV